MPVGKHGKKQAKAKKNGNRGRPVAASSSTGGAYGPVTERTYFPSLKSFRSHSFRSSSDHAHDSLYFRYKKSSQRLKDTLQSMVPPEIFQCDSVNAFMDATDYIVHNDLEVDISLLRDLKLSIRVRQRIALDKYGGGDAGHSYFIDVLRYCWSNLLPQCRTPKRKKQQQQASFDTTASTITNRFDKLSTSEDMDEESDDDDRDDLPSTPQPRPEEQGPTRLTIQELLEGSDRSNIILFLMTLGDLMSYNVLQFQNLKDFAADVRRKNLPASILVEKMMEASVTANFAIQQVAALEAAFIHDHPHLNTVYRVLANLVLPEIVETLTKVVTRNSPLASQFSEKHAIEFLGDAMECAFRNPSDPNNKSQSIVSEFLKQWNFRDSAGFSNAEPDADESIQQVFDGVQVATRLEIALEREHSDILSILSRLSNMGSHSWLRDNYIGKNRSITHTIRMVQCLSNLVKERHGRLISAQNGFFGTRSKQSWARIQIDMDEVLMGDIMPTLINMCYEGMMAMNLPFQDELLAGFVQIKTFVKYPERPVTWSLAFTIHTILTSLFEIQGPSAKFLAETAEATFYKYIQQLEWAEKMLPTTISIRPPIWNANVKSLQDLRYLLHVNIPQTRDQTLTSLWNPYCAGALLSYLAYYGNLEGGTSLVDSVAQLRVTLHLFNALKQAGVIRTDQIEVLDGVFEAFKDCKAIWEGPLPVKGQYRKQWLRAFGVKVNGARPTSATNVPSSNDDLAQEMTPIELDKLSKSFRRICLRDFSDVVDKYHTKEQRKKCSKKDGPMYKHAVRVNDTLDAMECDERLLATNLICLGFYLNQFYISLFNVWGWMAIVDKTVREAPKDFQQGQRTNTDSWEDSDENMKYQCMAHMFADRVMGALDDGDMLVASRCAEFMDVFYNKISPDMVMWFSPTIYE